MPEPPGAQSPRPARVLNEALGFGVSTPAVSSTRDSVRLGCSKTEAEEAVESAEADSSAPAAIAVAAVLPGAVALSVAAVACIIGGLYAWTELPTMMGWSEPAPPPVVSWYDSGVRRGALVARAISRERAKRGPLCDVVITILELPCGGLCTS